MRAATALSRMRARATSRMTSRANLRRETGLGDRDEDTGQRPRLFETTHTDLPGRLDAGHGHAGRTATHDVGGIELVRRVPEWHVPWGTQNVRQGDLIEVATGESAPLVLRIIDVPAGDQQTALRLPVEVTDRPWEWDA